MEISKINVPLGYKTKRVGDIKGVSVIKSHGYPYNVVEWAKNRNSFGPNYVIEHGEVMEVLPPSYSPNMDGMDVENIGILVIIDHNSDKALESLLSHIKAKVGIPNEPVKAHSVRSTAHNKKRKHK